ATIRTRGNDAGRWCRRPSSWSRLGRMKRRRPRPVRYVWLPGWAIRARCRTPLGAEAGTQISVDPGRAVGLLQQARALAEQVGNSWLLGGVVMVSLGGALEQAGSLSDALDAALAG